MSSLPSGFTGFANLNGWLGVLGGLIANNTIFALLSAAIFLPLLFGISLSLFRKFYRRKPGHKRRERQARRVLLRLESVTDNRQKIAYLRTVEPFVFEELILEAYERRGHKVKRNDRYTGDGGIDGRVWLDGELHLVQAKRYSGHIAASHVRSFCRVVEKSGCKGIFVHTGKTGEASKKLAKGNPHISFVSGSRLLELLAVESGRLKRGGREYV